MARLMGYLRTYFEGWVRRHIVDDFPYEPWLF